MLQPHLKTFAITDQLSPAGYHTLAYTEWGDPESDKILFCVHGLSRNSRDFDFVAEALQEDYRIICPDMPGRGRSMWLADPMAYNYATYVADCLALLDSLGIKKVDWLGTSMGGLIGMMVAIHAPERICKLVLNDVGPHLPAAALGRIKKYVGLDPRFKTLKDVENHLRVVLAPFGISDDAHWRHMAEHSSLVREDGLRALAYDPAIVKAFQQENQGGEEKDVSLWEIWEKIAHPTLVIRGEVSDILLPGTAEKMQQTGPKAQLIEIPGVGHAPALMDAKQIAIIKQWFETSA